jgi:hypothetical protein
MARIKTLQAHLELERVYENEANYDKLPEACGERKN